RQVHLSTMNAILFRSGRRLVRPRSGRRLARPTYRIVKGDRVAGEFSPPLPAIPFCFLLVLAPPWPGSPTATKPRRCSGRRLRRWLGCCQSRRRSPLLTVRGPPQRLQVILGWRSSLSSVSSPCGAV